MAKWFHDTYTQANTYIYIFLRFFLIIAYYKILYIATYAVTGPCLSILYIEVSMLIPNF